MPSIVRHDGGARVSGPAARTGASVVWGHENADPRGAARKRMDSPNARRRPAISSCVPSCIVGCLGGKSSAMPGAFSRRARDRRSSQPVCRPYFPERCGAPALDAGDPRVRDRRSSKLGCRPCSTVRCRGLFPGERAIGDLRSQSADRLDSAMPGAFSRRARNRRSKNWVVLFRRSAWPTPWEKREGRSGTRARERLPPRASIASGAVAPPGGPNELRRSRRLEPPGQLFDGSTRSGAPRVCSAHRFADGRPGIKLGGSPRTLSERSERLYGPH